MGVTFTFDFEKAFAALVYLASRTDEVSEFDKYKAAKLLFLADKYHLVRYGRPIIGDSYRALDYGPIPQQVVDLLHELTDPDGEKPLSPRAQRLKAVLEIDRRFKYPRLRARGPIDLDCLSKSDLMALDHVIATHGRKTFGELLALTHKMAAYRRAWEEKPSTAKAADMSYDAFFEEESDAVEGALEEMLENAELREVLPEYRGF